MIMKKKKYWIKYYANLSEADKKDILRKRKEKYHNDPEFRKRIQKANKKWQVRNHDKYNHYHNQYQRQYSKTHQEQIRQRRIQRATKKYHKLFEDFLKSLNTGDEFKDVVNVFDNKLKEE